jgi:hypothetical protein
MTIETASRHNVGGFEDRFRVTRTDGKPINPDARYAVFNYGRDATGQPLDPHALVAFRAYADSVEAENQQLATDFRDATFDPTKYPAQHD